MKSPGRGEGMDLGPSSCDEDLVRRLPLPLARLYRRAHNAKSHFDRHQAAYFLWEASVRLLASTAVIALLRTDPGLMPRHSLRASTSVAA